MNTRKSSPLPNPNDTLNQYRINYEVHYQNFHKYLMARVQKEKQARNVLIKEFNRYAKTIKKLQENSDDNDQNQLQVKQVKQKMQKVYNDICKRQLQIHKLLQEDEGVIMQLCELLNNKGKEIKSYRDTSSKNCTVTFLHHVSNIINAVQEYDTTLSVDNKDFQNSQQNPDQQQKSQEINSNQNQINSLQKTQKVQEIESIKEVETQCTFFNQNKQKSLSDESQNTDKLKQPVQNDKNSNQSKKEAINQPQKINSFKEKIQLIINQYKKSDQLTKDVIKSKIEFQNCIELNSSTDDVPTQNNTSNGHILKSPILEDNSKKNRLKKKKLLKSCITILD